MLFNEEDELYLEQLGWRITCYSPLEIEDVICNGFASGTAAELVIKALLER